MTDVLFDFDEMPEWEEMVQVLRQFPENEQQRIFGYIQGAKSVSKKEETEK
ncbi:hypothetical protein BN1050_02612 [Metalysinibacillus saudimassiliensis]|uniref:Uncharacterized protein n=1 Tax=Metalysinibacillus saudimassiliensis TaxID=1461583 RepID=A0A078MLV2_9BACL|nr:hypothetical protein BN1050_02612 [Metalysinibacillus saudimassiliensis]